MTNMKMADRMRALAQDLGTFSPDEVRDRLWAWADELADTAPLWSPVVGGWAEHRTICTVEELAALPSGTILRNSEDCAFQVVGRGNFWLTDQTEEGHIVRLTANDMEDHLCARILWHPEEDQ